MAVGNEGEPRMVRHLTAKRPAKTRKTTRRKQEAEINNQEERVLQAATMHLIRKVGGLFVATGLRKQPGRDRLRWLITVTLRYPTGHEGYFGDLLYDGEKFTMLTEDSV